MFAIWTYLCLFSDLTSLANWDLNWVHVKQAKVRLRLAMQVNMRRKRLAKLRPKITKIISDKDMSLARYLAQAEPARYLLLIPPIYYV